MKLLSFLAMFACSSLAHAAQEGLGHIEYQNPISVAQLEVPASPCEGPVLLAIEVRVIQNVQGDLLVVKQTDGRALGTVAFFSFGGPGSQGRFVVPLGKHEPGPLSLALELRASHPHRKLTEGALEYQAAVRTVCPR